MHSAYADKKNQKILNYKKIINCKNIPGLISKHIKPHIFNHTELSNHSNVHSVFSMKSQS